MVQGKKPWWKAVKEKPERGFMGIHMSVEELSKGVWRVLREWKDSKFQLIDSYFSYL